MDVFVLERKLVCTVTLPREGEKVARWAVYDLDNKKLTYGFSEGMEKSGVGCIPMAMSNAKRAARKILKKGVK
jgi:hypothetical protein